MNHATLSASNLVCFLSQPAMPQREKCQWNVACSMGQRKGKCWMCSEDSHCHRVIPINQDQFSSVLFSSPPISFFSYLLSLFSSHLLSFLFLLLLCSLLFSVVFFSSPPLYPSLLSLFKLLIMHKFLV
jgi:hypothetical protein